MKLNQELNADELDSFLNKILKSFVKSLIVAPKHK
jgi:hypothetical protein